jgi:hypothetical protein
LIIIIYCLLLRFSTFDDALSATRALDSKTINGNVVNLKWEIGPIKEPTISFKNIVWNVTISCVVPD